MLNLCYDNGQPLDKHIQTHTHTHTPSTCAGKQYQSGEAQHTEPLICRFGHNRKATSLGRSFPPSSSAVALASLHFVNGKHDPKPTVCVCVCFCLCRGRGLGVVFDFEQDVIAI